MHLTKPIIVDAALAILREYGLADMTMRRLAKQLGVAPGALYWHFPNKQALLGGIAQAMLEPFFAACNADDPTGSFSTSAETRTPDTPAPAIGAPSSDADSIATPSNTANTSHGGVDTSGQRDAVSDPHHPTVLRCVALRECLLQCTDGGEVVAAALATSPLLTQQVTALLGAADSADSTAGATTLLHYILGATVFEQTQLRLAQLQAGQSQPQHASSDDEPSAVLDPAVVSQHCEEQFQRSIRIIVNGMH